MTKVIRKIGAVILDEARERILVVRKFGKDTFIIPGGRPEGPETEDETLRRELTEELRLEVSSAEHLGDYVEPAEFEDAELRMSVYLVTVVGEPRVDHEIVEQKWIDSNYASSGIKVGSTLRNHVIPHLVETSRMRQMPAS